MMCKPSRLNRFALLLLFVGVSPHSACYPSERVGLQDKPASVKDMDREAKNPAQKPVQAKVDQATLNTNPGGVTAASASNAYGLDLLRQLMPQNGSRGNQFISPYSISSAMVLVAQGSGGKTAAQIATTFHFGSDLEGLSRSYSQLNARLVASSRNALPNPGEPRNTPKAGTANEPGESRKAAIPRLKLGIEYQANPTGGVAVTGVEPESLGLRVGIQPGDLIFAIDNQNQGINSDEDFTRTFNRGGDVIPIDIVKPNQQQIVVMIVGAGAQLLKVIEAGVPADTKTTQRDSVALVLTNAFWVQKGVKLLDSYLRRIEAYHGSSLQEVDFIGQPDQVLAMINDRIATQTNGRIAHLVDQSVANAETRLLLTNVLYFKGRWRNKFDPSMTKPAPFRGTTNPQAQVALMRTTGPFKLVHGKDYNAIELPYVTDDNPKKDAISMVVLLPEKEDGLPALEQALDARALADPLQGRQEMVVVDLRLPKFSISDKVDLTKMLSAQMPLAFSREEADFSGMTGQKDLRLSGVVHQTFLNVDEYGSEAAAATAVGIVPRCAPDAEFVADHPFLFLIRDNLTGTVLFLGRFTTP